MPIKYSLPQMFIFSNIIWFLWTAQVIILLRKNPSKLLSIKILWPLLHMVQNLPYFPFMNSGEFNPSSWLDWRLIQIRCNKSWFSKSLCPWQKANKSKPKFKYTRQPIRINELKEHLSRYLVCVLICSFIINYILLTHLFASHRN